MVDYRVITEQLIGQIHTIKTEQLYCRLKLRPVRDDVEESSHKSLRPWVRFIQNTHHYAS